MLAGDRRKDCQRWGVRVAYDNGNYVCFISILAKIITGGLSMVSVEQVTNTYGLKSPLSKEGQSLKYALSLIPEQGSQTIHYGP